MRRVSFLCLQGKEADFLMAILKFNGIEMPAPKYNGLTITHSKIWSKNTGRNSLGDMVGTIIAIKKTVDITWPPLTTQQIALIDGVVSDINNPFTTIEYLSPTGEMTTITAYFSDAPYPILSTNFGNGKQIMDGVQISGIQQ